MQLRSHYIPLRYGGREVSFMTYQEYDLAWGKASSDSSRTPRFLKLRLWECKLISLKNFNYSDRNIHWTSTFFSKTTCWHGNGVLGRKSSGSGLKSREYGRRDSSRWSRCTLYPHKVALPSPTSGCRSVGIVHLQTEDTEFSFRY
jgi:hypothetical protein